MYKKLLIGLSILISASAFAESQSRVYLARANAQLGSALENIQKAKNDDKSEHVQTFNYVALSSDITTIRGGIEDYLNNVRSLPTNIEILKAKYKE